MSEPSKQLTRSANVHQDYGLGNMFQVGMHHPLLARDGGGNGGGSSNGIGINHSSVQLALTAVAKSAMERHKSALPVSLTTSAFPEQAPRGPPKKPKINEDDVLSVLMAKLNEQQYRQPSVNKSSAGSADDDDDNSSIITNPYAASTPPADGTTDSNSASDANEVERLKKQLEFANQRMAQMDIELNQTRLAHHTVEQVISSPYPAPQNIQYNPFNGPLPAYNGAVTRQTTPFDYGGPPQSFGPAAMSHNGLMPAPAFHHNVNGSSHARPGPGFNGGRAGRCNGFASPMAPPNMTQSFPPYPHMPVMQAPIGTRLSPTASSFASSWNPTLAPTETISYMSTVEPLNYRRLLERDATCNWRYIVDKIVCSNDQQASIFLQQKLKLAPEEQKYGLIQAIIDQAYALMVNRFGNFLVQRCFEHGTPEQIVGIANAIRGNTLALSMDAFGCHVVQKAFDCVPEEYKTLMVHELLRRIPETVIHRYACHVWQKLFELRWNGSPPQIMKSVNEALRGMWHEVALGETGSLVVQNIFENCLEEDKRPCVNEVLTSIDVVAHGQFGNWCVQHICEHGSVPDRTRAVDHVIRYAAEYSMDQFASKVIEKCLKIGGTDFLDRYLNRVCESRVDRPRMPLIDIAGDQFGNYLVQYILINGESMRSEVVAAHIRKHMVSLRGSKYGSRVAMICSNPAYATRPGTPAGFSRVPGRPVEPVYDITNRSYNNHNHNNRSYVGMGRPQYGGYR
ncbi:hypothetical protein B0A48_15355 [Cryoendolithus antarcticus]|uniref:PUM-HD domain-containing protein n=1 Tax=Cryoendolithus antarcticus TaxID=1507870 RepID=A0A1V8SHY3_9PEZI|nr:hypothetical protein B0A48_15355 [Cryoendolithus antarcticus]